MSEFYWERHPDGPFATLIAVATTYCGPDAYDGAYAGSGAPGPMRQTPTTRRCACSRPSSGRRWPIRVRLPDEELSKAVEYDDGSDERFLRRVWRDLYGDEPVGGI